MFIFNLLPLNCEGQLSNWSIRSHFLFLCVNQKDYETEEYSFNKRTVCKSSLPGVKILFPFVTTVMFSTRWIVPLNTIP